MRALLDHLREQYLVRRQDTRDTGIQIAAVHPQVVDRQDAVAGIEHLCLLRNRDLPGQPSWLVELMDMFGLAGLQACGGTVGLTVMVTVSAALVAPLLSVTTRVKVWVPAARVTTGLAVLAGSGVPVQLYVLIVPSGIGGTAAFRVTAMLLCPAARVRSVRSGIGRRCLIDGRAGVDGDGDRIRRAGGAVVVGDDQGEGMAARRERDGGAHGVGGIGLPVQLYVPIVPSGSEEPLPFRVTAMLLCPAARVSVWSGPALAVGA